MAIKILSANCQGLATIEKRLDVLNYLKEKKNVIFIACKIHTQLNHQNAFSDRNGTMNACLVLAPLTLEGWPYFLTRMLTLEYKNHSLTRKETILYVIYQLQITNSP